MRIKPHVKAIVFYGSTAKGLHTQYSDLDVLIIVPLNIEQKYTQGEYIISFENQEINIVLRSIERLRKLATERKDFFEKEVFRNAELLYEADVEVRELLTQIALT